MKENRTYNKYKQPKSECRFCGGSGIITIEDVFKKTVIRCRCSERESYLYKSVLLDPNLTELERKAKLSQFKDNNAKIFKNKEKK